MFSNKKVVFVIGPSGIGKSTITKAVSEKLNITAVSLDDLSASKAVEYGIISARRSYDLLQRIGTDAFILFGAGCLFTYIDSHKGSIIVDVGAAFQNNKIILSLLQFGTVICLTAEPDTSFNRFCKHRGNNRTFNDHCLIEFSPLRSEVYSSAQHCIDTSRLSITETVNTLNDILRSHFKGGV